MGSRLNNLQNYILQNKPVSISSHLGSGLDSNFSLTVDDLVMEGPKNLTLLSGTNRIVIFEEEISEIKQGQDINNLLVALDNGTVLDCTSLNMV